MYCVSKILKAKKKSIEILRKTPMNGLTIVECSSKCVKDPSPLTSTMVSLSRKFLLSIDKEKAIRYKVPEGLIHKVEQKKTEDMHRHGRVLCTGRLTKVFFQAQV